MITMYMRAKLKSNIDSNEIIRRIKNKCNSITIEEVGDRYLVVTYPVPYHEEIKKIFGELVESKIYSLL